MTTDFEKMIEGSGSVLTRLECYRLGFKEGWQDGYDECYGDEHAAEPEDILG